MRNVWMSNVRIKSLHICRDTKEPLEKKLEESRACFRMLAGWFEAVLRMLALNVGRQGAVIG